MSSSKAVAMSEAAFVSVPIGSIILAAFGIDATTLVWGLFGGFLGAGYGPKEGRVRAFGNYLAASAISALGATAATQYFGVTSDVARYFIASILAFSFYPLKDLWISRLHVMLDWLAKRFLGSSQGGDK